MNIGPDDNDLPDDAPDDGEHYLWALDKAMAELAADPSWHEWLEYVDNLNRSERA